MGENMKITEFFNREKTEIYNQGVVLFGTREVAVFARRVLELYELNLNCYCDNNPNVIGTSINGVKVLSKEEAFAQFPDSTVIICSYNNVTTKLLKKDLREIGFNYVYSRMEVIWAYQTKVLHRNVDELVFMNSLNKTINKEMTTLDNVDVMITEKCTLRCKNCSLFIPYYNKPKEFSREDIVESIEVLSNSVDVIENITIMGGEPLLHKELVDICEKIAELSNVIQIKIVTNGTILPNVETLSALKKYVTSFLISDYNHLSREKDTLIEALKREGIHYAVFGDEVKWFKNTDIKRHNKSQSDNQKIFEQCFWKKKYLLKNGKISNCQVSYFGDENLLMDNHEDVINLLNHDESISKEIKQMIENKTYVCACDYCDIWKEIPVIKAEQTKNKLTFGSDG